MAVVVKLRPAQQIDRASWVFDRPHAADNYKSVIAAQNMKETLNGRTKPRRSSRPGRSKRPEPVPGELECRFQRAYVVEATNITETGEQQAATISAPSSPPSRRYESCCGRHAVYAGTLQARAYYFGTLEPAFERSETERRTCSI
jgi:hypothetical protein